MLRPAGRIWRRNRKLIAMVFLAATQASWAVVTGGASCSGRRSDLKTFGITGVPQMLSLND
jgi:hypothetical protein